MNNGGRRGEEEEQSEIEMSDHEAYMVRKSKQLRVKDRWEMLKYRMLTKQFCSDTENMENDDDGFDNDHGDLLMKASESEIKDDEWNEEREREFIFSLL